MKSFSSHSILLNRIFFHQKIFLKSKVYLHSTAQNQNPGIFIRDMESLTSLRKYQLAIQTSLKILIRSTEHKFLTYARFREKFPS
ncbi:hypothetical protein LEP1GSC133_3571 [Leptospira borgpetersenii serovar Pomona str. 200901868]|uniref:Uncharacterized protein n=1 Tax=Leptospira borgpetersenii serovar Pomona str. 200901868 TaxID=1192866 RepID=M6W001_LEPBO|nr:hypothetical protein LEP1GSC133_3571 [Leptospira borgpetersenii serovar Pomona str. 200901868]